MQYAMVIFSLSFYLYRVLDFFLALRVCEPLGRFIRITELINSFYSPVLLSFSITLFELIIFIH